MVETYKRKLEDLGDLRRQVSLLEERNHVYMQRTCELEEEQRRANTIRSQLDRYKRQVRERCLHCSRQHTFSTSTSRAVFITKEQSTNIKMPEMQLHIAFLIITFDSVTNKVTKNLTFWPQNKKKNLFIFV